ncbi:hypothetical protein LHJ74_20410 [Streptomyces sp. N2-109]|uniref:Uncharacterized protein n=1 Tax=Streptomyces gossypii TaxID=2883101 RepID=A0ABT2JWH9_9ACTN|nr:hypothetical protein [Streptomyces gossypii]MCT2592236.1 hypothetical protein [Streptomyces gossypii]
MSGYLPAPEPVPGCAACVRLREEGNAARKRGDVSGETDVRVLLARHLERAHR